MFKSFSMDLAGRKLTVEIGRVAAQANGAAFMHYGDTVVLSTATASSKPREGIDFFPLSVEYEEKLYAVGKIPGGFNKREGKASENAILTSRVIDRPMRPLFPKDYRNDVTLDNVVMSVDPECSPELTAMLGSAIATSISDIPFDGPCATTQVGLIDGEFIINPTARQLINCYGVGYAGHPRMEKLLEQNDIKAKDYLNGSQEAAAFANKEYVKLHMSTLRKVDVFSNILNRAINNTLKVNSKWTEIYGISIQGILNYCKDTWWIQILWTLVSMVIGTVIGELIGKII